MNKKIPHIKATDMLIFQDQPEINPRSQEFVDFWMRHIEYCKSGVFIGGVYFSGWLYWHINFFKVTVPVKDEYGKIKMKVDNLSFRDNEYMISHYLERAEKEETPIILFGTRRFTKSVWLASTVMYQAYVYKNSHSFVIGGSTTDINNITKYIDEFYEHRQPCFEDIRMYGNWDKMGSDIQVGYNKRDLKNPNLMIRTLFGDTELKDRKHSFSRIAVRNLEYGLKKYKGEILAGGTPTEVIFDEVGKFSWSSYYQALKPALDTHEGLLCLPKFVGTGGEIEKSADAEAAFLTADKKGFLTTDLSDYKALVKDEYFPYKQKSDNKVGVFVPAQLSMTGKKNKGSHSIPFTDYLDRKFTKKQREDLKGLNIFVTDWDAAKENVLKKIEEDSDTDKERKKQEMYYPWQPEDCFKYVEKNPFPVEEAKRTRRKLKEMGLEGERCWISQRVDGSFEINETDKVPVVEFPFNGGMHDAPVIINERPIFDNPRLIKSGTYVAGFDGYKIAQSETTDSVGVFYIYKRKVGLKGYQDQIVASIATRPNDDTTFYRQCMFLLQMYNAECLPERDVNFYNYLRGKNELNLLADCKDLAKGITPNTRADTSYGLPATAGNKEYYFKLIQKYCWEEIVIDLDEDDNEITMLGVERITDPMLLLEIEKYGQYKNYDRLVAFGHALSWAKELTTNKIEGSSERHEDKFDIEKVLKKRMNRKKRYTHMKFPR